MESTEEVDKTVTFGPNTIFHIQRTRSVPNSPRVRCKSFCEASLRRAKSFDHGRKLNRRLKVLYRALPKARMKVTISPEKFKGDIKRDFELRTKGAKHERIESPGSPDESFNVYIDPIAIGSVNAELLVKENGKIVNKIPIGDATEESTLRLEEIGVTVSKTKLKLPELRTYDNDEFTKFMSKEESDFVKKRKIYIHQAIQKLLDEELGPNEVPHIALMGSGGGYRAMIAMAGVFCALDDTKLLDTTLYSAALSGSSWYLAALYSDPDWPNITPRDFKNDLRRNVLSKSHDLRWICSKGACQAFYYKMRDMKWDFTSDVFGPLLGKTLLPERQNCKWSEQARKLGEGTVPLPLLSAIHAKNDESTNNFHEWVEFSPFEVHISKYGAAIKMEHFGSAFTKGVLDYKEEEIPLYLLMGICGSAYALRFDELKNKESQSNLCSPNDKITQKQQKINNSVQHINEKFSHRKDSSNRNVKLTYSSEGQDELDGPYANQGFDELDGPRFNSQCGERVGLSSSSGHDELDGRSSISGFVETDGRGSNSSYGENNGVYPNLVYDGSHSDCHGFGDSLADQEYSKQNTAPPKWSASTSIRCSVDEKTNFRCETFSTNESVLNNCLKYSNDHFDEVRSDILGNCFRPGVQNGAMSNLKDLDRQNHSKDGLALVIHNGIPKFFDKSEDLGEVFYEDDLETDGPVHKQHAGTSANFWGVLNDDDDETIEHAHNQQNDTLADSGGVLNDDDDLEADGPVHNQQADTLEESCEMSILKHNAQPNGKLSDQLDDENANMWLDESFTGEQLKELNVIFDQLCKFHEEKNGPYPKEGKEETQRNATVGEGDDEIDGFMGDLLRKGWCYTSRAWRAAHTKNFLRKVSFNEHDPPNDETEGGFLENFFKTRKEEETLCLLDAGIAFNSPYPLLFQPGREIDLILSFDFTDRKEDYKQPFKTILKASEWARKHSVKFPPIDVEKYQGKPVEELYIFEDEKDLECPIIMHFVLVNKEFWKYSKPGIERSREEQEKLKNFKVFDDKIYDCQNFKYTEENFDRLSELSEYIVLNNAEKIKECIRKSITRKRKLNRRRHKSA